MFLYVEYAYILLVLCASKATLTSMLLAEAPMPQQQVLT